MKYFNVFMAIDEQLMDRNNSSEKSSEDEDDESMTAGNLREERRSASSSNQQEEGKSLRELKMEQMRSDAANKNAAVEAKGASKPNPVLKLTDELLKFYWENLLTSWGFTLILIDLHVFLNKVFGPTVFREVGEEWFPEEVKKVLSKLKSVSALTRLVEGSGVVLLNLGCLFYVIFTLSLTAMIVSAISSPLETLYKMLVSNGFSGFIDMIKALW